MTRLITRSTLGATCLMIVMSIDAGFAQTQAPAPAQGTSGSKLGVDVFGGAGVSFPAAHDSVEAVGLRSTAFEFGGGVRLTGLWRKIFAQVAYSQWSDDGERAFVSSEGEVFPLGIPLDVDARFIDATVGVKDVVRKSNGKVSYLTYVGGGAGVVRYRERSPFAEPGDDLDTTEPSYHVLGGVEVPITGPLALVVDGRYRYIPGVLGDGGASSVLGEDSLGGFQASVGVRLGFGGPSQAALPPRKPAVAAPEPQDRPVVQRPPQGVITVDAPVYVLPDATRTPLRTLSAGMNVRILEQKGDWTRVEFNDPQYGSRVGYVQSKFVQRQTP